VNSLEFENNTLKFQLSKIGVALRNDPVIMERLKSRNKQQKPDATRTTGTIALFVIVFAFSLSLGGFAPNFFSKPESVSTGRKILEYPISEEPAIAIESDADQNLPLKAPAENSLDPKNETASESQTKAQSPELEERTHNHQKKEL